MNYAEMKQTYAKWSAGHPWAAGLVVTAEAAAIGAITDMIVNGTDFKKEGGRHIGTMIGAAVIIAVRNYLRSSPMQQIAQPAPEPNKQP